MDMVEVEICFLFVVRCRLLPRLRLVWRLGNKVDCSIVAGMYFRMLALLFALKSIALNFASDGDLPLFLLFRVLTEAWLIMDLGLFSKSRLLPVIGRSSPTSEIRLLWTLEFEA